MIINDHLRPDADNLSEVVSDAVSSMGRISARDIAELYADQNAVDGISEPDFKELVKLLVPQVKYYLLRTKRPALPAGRLRLMPH